MNDASPLCPVVFPSVTLVVCRSAGDIAPITNAGSTPDFARREVASTREKTPRMRAIDSNDPTLLPR